MGYQMVMNIEEALLRFAEMPSDSVLLAKPPFTWASEAIWVPLMDVGGVPESAKQAGFEYLLERDEIEYELEFLKTKKIGSRAVAEFIIHYAVYDSPPAWIEEIPNA
jgi:hypothetical protein